MFLSYVTIWYPLGFRLNTMYGEKSSMIVQGLPHACGGVSNASKTPCYCARSSPRMWGCFLLYRTPQRSQASLPHACGGVSLGMSLKRLYVMSSPRMWGCFSVLRPFYSFYGVFPTHVGVFLNADWEHRMCHRSSPRMWGCFPNSEINFTAIEVFPTHVGVFLRMERRSHIKLGLPHACGGVSHSELGYRIIRVSSPRMWGCFFRRI